MDYTATVTLTGSPTAAQSEQIARLLDVYAASVSAGGSDDQPDRFTITLIVRAGSTREAVIRALSATDDLGYRVAALRVLP